MVSPVKNLFTATISNQQHDAENEDWTLTAAPQQTTTRQLLLNKYPISPGSPDSVSIAEDPLIVEVNAAHEKEWVPYQDVGASINRPIP